MGYLISLYCFLYMVIIHSSVIKVKLARDVRLDFVLLRVLNLNKGMCLVWFRLNLNLPQLIFESSRTQMQTSPAKMDSNVGALCGKVAQGATWVWSYQSEA